MSEDIGWVSLYTYWGRTGAAKSKAVQKPFFSWRRITKGRHKGRIEVEINLYKRIKIIVEETAIREFPGGEES